MLNLAVTSNDFKIQETWANTIVEESGPEWWLQTEKKNSASSPYKWSPQYHTMAHIIATV
jgi:hypothetical protein